MTTSLDPTSTEQPVGPPAGLPKFGVGLLYNPALPGFLRAHLDTVDFLEVIPDTFWTDRGPAHSPRYCEIEESVKVLNWVAERRPIIAHSIGLSIGSADLFDPQHIDQIALWHRRYHFPWHSDHLSFVRVKGATGYGHEAGMAVPIPYDDDMLQIIAERTACVQATVPAPFLLENNVYFVELPEQQMTEAQFLNRLAAKTGCGLLLDVHNVYANARNHAFSASEFIDQLDLTRVVEVHIAGGSELAGMYTDSHAGPCPQPVWDLLRHVVASATHLRAITFEFHDSYFRFLGDQGILDQLRQARDIWSGA